MCLPALDSALKMRNNPILYAPFYALLHEGTWFESKKGPKSVKFVIFENPAAIKIF
jgi:hypothetical protein